MFQLWQSKNVANGIMLYLSYLILKLVCKGWLGFKLPLEFLIVFLVLSFQFLGLFLKPIDLNNRVILQCSQLYILSILRFRRGKKHPHTSFSSWLNFAVSFTICFLSILFWKRTSEMLAEQIKSPSYVYIKVQSHYILLSCIRPGLWAWFQNFSWHCTAKKTNIYFLPPENDHQ